MGSRGWLCIVWSFVFLFWNGSVRGVEVGDRATPREYGQQKPVLTGMASSSLSHYDILRPPQSCEMRPVGEAATLSYQLAVYYVLPTDIPYENDVHDQLIESTHHLQAWYQVASGGVTWKLAYPEIVRVYYADHPRSFYTSDWWGLLLTEMQSNGYPIWSAGTITALWVRGAGGFAGGAQWCDGDCGVALLGVEIYPQFNNPEWSGHVCPGGQGVGAFPCTPEGAYVHELGHTLGLQHPIDVPELAPYAYHSVMQTHWNFPDFAPPSESPWGFLRPERVAIRANPFMHSGVSLYQYYPAADVVNLPPSGSAPTAGFSVDRLSDLEIQCLNSSSGATHHYWTFGDGSVSTESSPVHAYQGEGTYEIILRASNDASMIGTDRCSFNTKSIDLGPVAVGSSCDTTLTIMNSGTETVTGWVGESCDGFAVVSGGGNYSLAPGESLVIEVRFEPATAGLHVCHVEMGALSCTGREFRGDAVLVGAASWQKISDTEGGFTGTLDDLDYLGCSLCRVGDLDGDEVEDLAVGADCDDDGGTDRGAVWVLFLNVDGTVKACQKISDTEGGFAGVLDNDDEMGISVCSVGDLDGDGIPDLAAGAYRDDDGGTNRGAVWVLFMNANGTVKAFQKISDTQGGFTGTLDDYDFFGCSVCSLGDLNGDGVEDLAVGALHDDDGGDARGAVWVLFLNTNGTVKAYQKISGTEGGFMGILDNSDFFGSSLCGLEDLDGDGIHDLAAGALYDDDGGTDRGAVWVLFMNTDGTVKAHQKVSDTQGGSTGVLDNGDCFGTSVDLLGDLDGDGIQDLAVGAQYDDDGGTDRGAVWLLFMNANGTVKEHQKISDTRGGLRGTLEDSDCFAVSVCSLGDLNSDGFEDLVVGAYGDDDGGHNRGAVWVVFLDAYTPSGIPDEQPASPAYIQIFPNPLTDVTHIRFSLDHEATVALAIYDVGGRLVRILLNQHLGPGTYCQVWDGCNHTHEQVSAGVYFCRLDVAGEARTTKIILSR
ncbi:MAG: FG-GAP-like repeat-containing protein [Candidatus Eisenbacteria bacterium]